MAITLQLVGPCFLGKRRLESYWVKSSAAWFLNGPGGHLVTCAAGPSGSCLGPWGKGFISPLDLNQTCCEAPGTSDMSWVGPCPICLFQLLSKYLMISLYLILEFLDHHSTNLCMSYFLSCVSGKFLFIFQDSVQISPPLGSTPWRKIVQGSENQTDQGSNASFLT